MPEIGYLEAINQALHEEMERDKNVFMAGIDIAERGDVFGATQGLYSKYGKSRIMDTPIAENGIIGLAIGSAARGLRPVVTIMFMDFIGVCFDQILNQMAKMKYMFGGKVKLPLVVLTNAGAGTSSAAQHSQSLEVLLCHIPGLKVVMPSAAYDAKGLMKAAIREDNPVFFVQHKRLGRIREEVPEGDYEVPIGKASIVREGKDITIVATSLHGARGAGGGRPAEGARHRGRGRRPAHACAARHGDNRRVCARRRIVWSWRMRPCGSAVSAPRSRPRSRRRPSTTSMARHCA